MKLNFEKEKQNKINCLRDNSDQSHNGCNCKMLAAIMSSLTHWGRVMHICISKLTIIGLDNGLSPGRRQAIIWTNVGISLIRTLGTNFSEILGEIHSFSFSKMHLKMSSAKWHLFGLGLNELKWCHIDIMASHITSKSTVCSTHQRKHQSSTTLAFVSGILQWLVDSPHK